MRSKAGFTLIEMLVVVILMIMIVGVVANIFSTSKEVVSRNEARNVVYVNGGYSMDRMMVDLFGCLPFTSGTQRFVMHNYKIDNPADMVGNKNFYNDAVAAPAVEELSGHYNGAADVFSFRTVTTAGDVAGLYQVTYYLRADPEGGARLKTWRSNRPIYTLMRRVTVQGVAITTANWTTLPQVDLDNNGTPETNVQEEEVCHYVLSFNVEYLSNKLNFSQLQPSPCKWSEPLGDGLGANDLNEDGVSGTVDDPYRIPAVRVTLIVCDDNGERSERMISHVFEIPMG